MSLLNLKSFLNTVNKLQGYYYNHADYHIFTNGQIVYAVSKETETEQLEMLLNDFDKKVKYSNVLNEVVELYHNGVRCHVSHFKYSFIKDKRVVKVFTGFNNKKYTVISAKYKKCCKSKPNTPKEQFIINSALSKGATNLYFETTPLTGEFVCILPINMTRS